jgi:TRAP-type C4-dicarboxylate transport system permease large subunit
MGLNVYVVNGMAPGVPLSESFRGVLPFLVSDFIRIGLILAFPGIALWLVKFMN